MAERILVKLNRRGGFPQKDIQHILQSLVPVTRVDFLDTASGEIAVIQFKPCQPATAASIQPELSPRFTFHPQVGI